MLTGCEGAALEVARLARIRSAGAGGGDGASGGASGRGGGGEGDGHGKNVFARLAEVRPNR
jgi:hypothetical protein